MVSATTSASYSSWIHLSITLVSRPPEYSSSTRPTSPGSARYEAVRVCGVVRTCGASVASVMGRRRLTRDALEAGVYVDLPAPGEAAHREAAVGGQRDRQRRRRAHADEHGGARHGCLLDELEGQPP